MIFRWDFKNCLFEVTHHYSTDLNIFDIVQKMQLDALLCTMQIHTIKKPLNNLKCWIGLK